MTSLSANEAAPIPADTPHDDIKLNSSSGPGGVSASSLTGIGGPLDSGQPQPQPSPSQESLHVIFMHLDWGIGGAEQLMLQLCVASVAAGHSVELVTSRCDPSHCFALLKPPALTASNETTPGSLYPYLHVWGKWIPSHILGKGQALLSTVRLLYLAYWVARKLGQRENNNNSTTKTLIVTDVLPTPLWILRYFTSASLLFYCHFPDQLLIRTTETNIAPGPSLGQRLKRWYRQVLDGLEESSMRLADTITVNSKFTQATVRQTFRSLHDVPLPVLYPALDVSHNAPTGPTSSSSSSSASATAPTNTKNTKLIVSLNRFERKKNLGLLIEAAAWMQSEQAKASKDTVVDYTLVIAGGYDKRNVENVEYRAELGQLAATLNVAVDFRLSISDAERQELLTTALIVVYTPTNEHFGIVPLEAMHAGTAVVASRTGGPMETVVSGTTGILCEYDTAASFGAALLQLIQDPNQAIVMGQAGRRHVEQSFMPQRLQREWVQLTHETVQRGTKRHEERRANNAAYRVVSPRVLWILCEAMVVFSLCIFMTMLLRLVNVLHPHQSILGRVRQVVLGDSRDEL